ncbi:head fiber protein [Eubacteriaceae bacterium ES3]|nr:head fiber protein [Eubacteriaceae bacterium ES3]
MSYTTKNYTEQGGEKTVIGGTLEIKEGALLLGMPQADFQADSSATTVTELVTDFNALLAKLKSAGLLKTE